MALSLVSTTDTQIIRVVEAMFALQPGYTYMVQFQQAVADTDLDTFANSLLPFVEGNDTAEGFASLVVANLGIKDPEAVTQAEAYLADQFNVNDADNWGAVVLETANLFSGLGSDPVLAPIYGADAEVFNTAVANSLTYSLDPNNTVIFDANTGAPANQVLEFNITPVADGSVMRLTGNLDTRIDITATDNQVTGLDLNGDGVIAADGIENSNPTTLDDGQDYTVIDAYARNPLDGTDYTSNFLGDIEFDGTGFGGDGVNSDGNIFLGGLGADTVFAGIGNDFLTGGQNGGDDLKGGRNADFFFVELSQLSSVAGDSLDIDGGSTWDNNPNQDSDWILLDASDDDEPVTITLNNNGDAVAGSDIITRSGVSVNADEIENLNASGNLYDFLNGMDVSLGGGQSGVAADGSSQTATSMGSTAQLIVNGSGSDNIIIGGYDNDTLSGGSGNDILFGGDMQFLWDNQNNPNIIDQFMVSNDGRDNISGGAGDDSIMFEMDGGLIDGGAGNDTLWLTNYTGGGLDNAADKAAGGVVRLDLEAGTLGGIDNAAGYGGADELGSTGAYTADQTNYLNAQKRTDVQNMENINATGLGAIDYDADGGNDSEVSFMNQANYQGLGQVDLDLRGIDGVNESVPDLRQVLLNSFADQAAAEAALEAGPTGTVTQEDLQNAVDDAIAAVQSAQADVEAADAAGIKEGDRVVDNNLYADKGHDVLEGRGGNDNLMGYEGDDDFIFSLKQGDDLNVIHRLTDANGDNIWDGTYERDFLLDSTVQTGTSSLILDVSETNDPGAELSNITVTEISSVIRDDAGDIAFTLDTPEIRAANTYDELLTAIDSAIAADPNIADTLVATRDGNTILITDSQGRTMEDTAPDAIFTVSANNLDVTVGMTFGEPEITVSGDRIIFASYENRLDNELVDDDGMVNNTGDAVSLGRDAYAEDLVVRFASDENGTVTTTLSESQSYDVVFRNLADEDMVTIDINGVQFSAQMGVAADGTALRETPAEFLTRFANVISAANDNDTKAGQVSAVVDVSATVTGTGEDGLITLTQVAYNGGETVFMDKPVVNIDHNGSNGEPPFAFVVDNTSTSVELFQFDGRDNQLNNTDVLFIGDTGISRAVLETALTAGGELVGSDAIVYDTMVDADTDALDFSLHGDDLLITGAGDDVVSGGTGDDRIQGSIGDDIVNGGKDHYQITTTVAGESVLSVAVMNGYEAGLKRAEADVTTVEYLPENDESGAQNGYADTLVFNQNDFTDANFTITIDSDMAQQQGGQGIVSVDEGKDGVFDYTTTFSEMEAVRTLSGNGTHAGQGDDTLDVQALSDVVAASEVEDADAAVIYNMTSELGVIAINADLNSDGFIDPDGSNTGDENNNFMAVDGVERFLGGNANEQLNIDESEVNKDNWFDGDNEVTNTQAEVDASLADTDTTNDLTLDLVGDSIVYDHTDMNNDGVADDDGKIDTDRDGIADFTDDVAVSMRPALTLAIETDTEVDTISMTGGTIVGSDTTVDTLVDVETINVTDGAISPTLDDTLDVTHISGSTIDFAANEVRSGDTVLAQISGMSEIENARGGSGNDLVIVADTMSNYRLINSVDADTAIALPSFLSYDTSGTAGRLGFTAIDVADRPEANNQALYTFDGGSGTDRVEYAAETGNIAAVINLVDGESSQTVFALGNDLDLADKNDRTDLLLNTEEIVASQGVSVLDFTDAGQDIEVTFQYDDTNGVVSSADRLESIIRIADSNSNTISGIGSFIEYYDLNENSDVNSFTDATWNQIEGSDFADSVIYQGSEDLVNRSGLDHRFTNDTLNLRGGDNGVAYNALETSITATITVTESDADSTTVANDEDMDYTTGSIVAEITFQDGDGGVLPGSGTHTIKSYTSDNDIAAGTFKLEASQDAEDTVSFVSASNKTFILGSSAGILDVKIGELDAMRLTGFEFLQDANTDDIYQFESLITGIGYVDDGRRSRDTDTIKVNNSAIAFNSADTAGSPNDNEIDLAEFNGLGIDFDIIDATEVNSSVSIGKVDITGTNGAQAETVIIDDLSIYGNIDKMETIKLGAGTSINGTLMVDTTGATPALSDNDNSINIDAGVITLDLADLTSGQNVIAKGLGNIIGSTGDDSIQGSSGNDIILGGLGVDSITGGQDVAEVHSFTLENTAAAGETITIDGVTVTIGQEIEGVVVSVDDADAIGSAFERLFAADSTQFNSADLLDSVFYDPDSNALQFNFKVSEGDISDTLIGAATGTATAAVGAETVTTAYANNGNDTFIAIGTIADGEYSTTDLTGTAAETLGVSDLILKAKTTSDVTSDTIVGGEGSDTLEVWGTIDFTAATLSGLEVLNIHSNVTLSAEQYNSFSQINITSEGAALTLVDDATGSSQTFTAALDAEGLLTVKDDQGNNLSDVNPNVGVNEPANNPTYTVTAGAASVDEGNSVDFTLATTNVAEGTQLTYTLSGDIDANDIDGNSLTGTVTVDATGAATATVSLLADATTEGAENLTLTIEGADASVTVNDTSTETTGPQVIELTAGEAATGTANTADTFSLTPDSGSFTISDFEPGIDTLQLNLGGNVVTTATNLVELNGQALATGTLSVDFDPFQGDTSVFFGADDTGAAISLTLVGIDNNEQALVAIEVI